MSERPAPDLTEAIKLGFEAMKQLTTLNAGSIVVIGTFLSNIFPTDRQGTLTVPLYIKILIGLAFVGFGASLLLSTYVLILYRRMLESRAFRDVLIGTDRESVRLIVRSDEPIPGRSWEEESVASSRR
jgi:hypothetical protein